MTFITRSEIKYLKNLDFKKFVEIQTNIKEGEQNDSGYNAFKQEYLKSQQGLPFMLEQNYFTDAFVLHDQTDVYPFLQMMLLSDVNNKIEFENPLLPSNILGVKNDNQIIDERRILHEKWASPKCFYKFQPLNLIRNYFICNA